MDIKMAKQMGILLYMCSLMISATMTLMGIERLYDIGMFIFPIGFAWLVSTIMCSDSYIEYYSRGKR